MESKSYTMYGVCGNTVVMEDEAGEKIYLVTNNQAVWIYPTFSYTLDDLKAFGEIDDSFID